MKKKIRLFSHLFIAMGLLILLTFSCNKDDDNNVAPPPPTVTDIDGNVYNIVTIGTQTWLVENLKVTKYNDTTDIPLVTGSTAWENLTTSAYCWYENNEAAHKNPYGALYNWYTVNTSNLCPTGWHVPTNLEWIILTDFLEGESLAGGKLKETGTSHWASPNTAATNESGFTALPGGARFSFGPFNFVGDYGYWWSSSESNTAEAWGRRMDYDSSHVFRDSFIKQSGFSVRCLKD